jgi:hypothetical protein
MKRSTAPFLIVLLLGLAAAVYFIFTPTDSLDDSVSDERNVSEVEQADDLNGASKSADNTGDAANSIQREDATPAGVDAASIIITQVRVLNPDGSGAENVRVLPWLGKEFQEEVLTNEAGEATLLGLEGYGGYAILPPDRLSLHSTHTFDGSPIHIQLQEGAELSGRVFFKKPRESQEPFFLRVSSKSLPDLEGIPIAISNDFGSKKPGVASAILNIDEAGNFRLSSLPDSWAGRIHLPHGYIACSVDPIGEVEDHGFITIPHVVNNLALQVLELPAFTGRVVSPDGSEGVAGASIWLGAFLNDKENDTYGLMGRSGEDGQFRIPIYASNAEEKKAWCANVADIHPYSVNVQISDSDEWAEVAIPLELHGKVSPWDLGDLPMQERVDLRFRALDEHGQPIAGALAYSFELSEPTDEDGYSQVAISEETTEVRVAAHGFETASKQVPSSLEDVLDFTLTKAVHLQVSWIVPEGMDMSLYTLRIDSEEHVFQSGDGAMDHVESRFRRSFGLDNRNSRRSGISGSTQTHFRLESNQAEFDIWGLQSGVPMKVMLAGRLKSPLTTSTSLVFSPGEERVLELPAFGMPALFSGTVVDESGAPLDRVMVMVNSETMGTGGTTSSEGKFSFSGLVARRIPSLTLRKSGFANIRLEDYLVPQDGKPVEFIMERAREVTFYLRDSQGRSYPDGYISCVGEESDKENTDFGMTFESLPQSDFELEWYLGGAKGKVWVPADITEFDIAVPDMAAAIVQIKRLKSKADENLQVTFIPQGGSSESEQMDPYSRTFHVDAADSSLDGEIPALTPGTYIVEYSIYRRDGIWDWESLYTEGTVTVIPGQLLELDLEF